MLNVSRVKITHYCHVITGAMSSQITSLTSVYLTVYLSAYQRKYQSSASLAFVRGIHRWTVNSPHKCQWRGKCFHLMTSSWWRKLKCIYGKNFVKRILERPGEQATTLLAKMVVTPPLKTIKPTWIELLCFHLAEIGMIWTRDCSPTKSDTTLGRHSMQGQVGSSSSETAV